MGTESEVSEGEKSSKIRRQKAKEVKGKINRSLDDSPVLENSPDLPHETEPDESPIIRKNETKDQARKRIKNYKTFKKKRNNIIKENQILVVIDDDKLEVEETEKIESNSKVLSPSEINFSSLDEIGSSSIFRRGPRKRSKILENVKIGTDSFRCMKRTRFQDSYKTLKCIGQGGYGQVYKVEHKTFKYIRAMKIIPKNKVKKDKDEEMIKEFDILRKMDHPNIVRLFELFQDNHNYYLITEYCKGGDICSLIQKSSEFCEYNAIKIIQEIVSSVLYCHDNNIVHRDIKAENVMFSERDLESTIKLIDFGISLKFRKDHKIKDKTGTILYVAPEVLKGSYDEKCDVWSCGVLMYLILCGYPPFYGNSRRSVMKKILNQKPSFKAKIWKRISTDAKDLIKKMLIKNPDQRPSCHEVLNHPWFKNREEEDYSLLCSKTYLESMRRFQASSKLSQAIMTFIVSNVSFKEVSNEALGVFRDLDTDNDGKITYNELLAGFRRIYPQWDEPSLKTEVKYIMEEIDSNISGAIDYTEFLVSCLNKEKMLNRRMVDQAFHEFDLNNDGFISREEFQAVMGGVVLDQLHWDEFLIDCDKDKDGKISKEEFCEFIEHFCKQQ